MPISTGDTTSMLGSYSSFDVRTVLNIRFTLPANLVGYSSTVTDPQGYILFQIKTGSFDRDFGTSLQDFNDIPCALAKESVLAAINN